MPTAKKQLRGKGPHKKIRIKLIIKSKPKPRASLTVTCNGPKFTLFAQLPLEIRNMVWKYALPDPKVVEIRSTFCNAKGREIYHNSEQDSLNQPHEPLEPNWAPTSSEDIPVLLSVCYESRMEALRSYRVLRGTMGKKITYVDWERDILALTARHFSDPLSYFIDTVDEENLRAIRFLAFDAEHEPNASGTIADSQLVRLSGLERLIFWESSSHNGVVLAFPEEELRVMTKSGALNSGLGVHGERSFAKDIHRLKRENPAWKGVEILVGEAVMECTRKGRSRCYCKLLWDRYLNLWVDP